MMTKKITGSRHSFERSSEVQEDVERWQAENLSSPLLDDQLGGAGSSGCRTS
jgi:hypothetical protein